MSRAQIFHHELRAALKVQNFAAKLSYYLRQGQEQNVDVLFHKVAPLLFLLELQLQGLQLKSNAR